MNMMDDDRPWSSRRLARRYFEMWNTGDATAAEEILSPDWVDHAHPEVAGPQGVREAIERIRGAQPDLRFRIDAVLGESDLVAVVGNAGRGQDADGTPLVWLIRVRDGLLAEMRTYRDTGR
ncbi:nuclear transport factor 2 family protein [Microbispora sp. NEAU-D428]|uniref:ester cyclase n=1 Tax=Microbispora sitophila TaxID=2771537 RepID=UPI001865D47B|nr:nuclear transport factor 2 family protein [Microbispora sitophila]MBE3009154.1 nuclear transport factor 2 family protein [Microbispora sitophila]